MLWGLIHPHLTLSLLRWQRKLHHPHSALLICPSVLKDVDKGPTTPILSISSYPLIYTDGQVPTTRSLDLFCHVMAEQLSLLKPFRTPPPKEECVPPSFSENVCYKNLGNGMPVWPSWFWCFSTYTNWEFYLFSRSIKHGIWISFLVLFVVMWWFLRWKWEKSSFIKTRSLLSLGVCIQKIIAIIYNNTSLQVFFNLWLTFNLFQKSWL